MPSASRSASSGPTRSAAVLRSVVGAMGGLGIDTEALLDRVGMDVRALQALRERVPIRLHNQVWQAATEMSDKPGIGALVAGMLYIEMYDVVGGVVRHSATLGDAVIRLSRFGRLLGAGFDMQLEVHGEQCVLREPHYPEPTLHLQGTVCQLASIGLNGRRLTGQPLQATELRIMGKRPADACAMQELIDSPLHFGASHNAIVFPTEHLLKPIVGRDATQLDGLEREAVSLLGRTPREETFASTVEALLSLGFAGESAEAIAKRLEVTPRTLTRRLAAEGTTFQGLRDDVRRRLAESYLRRSSTPTADIGISLGFSDAAAFSRAFRRWTGVSPVQYRRSAGSPSE